MTGQPKKCLWCKKDLPAGKRMSQRKFCDDACRYAWHGSQRPKIGDASGVIHLADKPEVVQALWTDLYAVFKKYGMIPNARSK
jgi:hypothetical protein